MRKIFLIICIIVITIISFTIIKANGQETVKDKVKVETVKPDSLQAGKNYSKFVFNSIITERQSRIKEINSKIYELEQEKKELQKQIDLLAQLIQFMQ